MSLVSRLANLRVPGSLYSAADALLKKYDRQFGAIAEFVGAAPGDDLVAAVSGVVDERDDLRAGFIFLGYDPGKGDVHTWAKGAKETLDGTRDAALDLQAEPSAWRKRAEEPSRFPDGSRVSVARRQSRAGKRCEWPARERGRFGEHVHDRRGSRAIGVDRADAHTAGRNVHRSVAVPVVRRRALQRRY